MSKTITLKDNTINKLDEIATIRLRKLLKGKSLYISLLIKNKRGISYNDEINNLAEQYLYCHKRIISNPNLKCVEVLKKIDKI